MRIDDITSGLSRRIQRIVDEKKIRKSEFARSLGVSPNYIYQIVSGRRKNISESLAKLIEALYGYPSGWVLYGNEDADTRAEAIRKLQRMDSDNAKRAAEFIDALLGSGDDTE